MTNDIADMEVQISCLMDDLEHEKDRANFFQMSYEEERDISIEARAECVELRDRMSRAIDLIPLTDKTREGLSVLRVGRVRSDLRAGNPALN